MPFARLYCTVFSLQPCHLPDFISLVSVYSPATHQTLWHWFQFTAVPLVRLYFISLFAILTLSDFISWLQFAVLPLVRLYFIGFSLQSCHLPDLIYPGSDDNLLISALRFIIWKVTMFFGYVAWAHDLMHTTLQLCHWPEYTSPGPRCDLTGQNLFH